MKLKKGVIWARSCNHLIWARKECLGYSLLHLFSHRTGEESSPTQGRAGVQQELSIRFHWRVSSFTRQSLNGAGLLLFCLILCILLENTLYNAQEFHCTRREVFPTRDTPWLSLICILTSWVIAPWVVQTSYPWVKINKIGNLPQKVVKKKKKSRSLMSGALPSENYLHGEKFHLALNSSWFHICVFIPQCYAIALMFKRKALKMIFPVLYVI